MGKKIDLTGQTFGKLTVLEEAQERNRSGSVCWVCQCECGNIVIVNGDNLRRNHTKSCGCQKKESAQARVVDLTGQRFGKLVVNRKTNNPYPGNRHTYWLCDCDCGRSDILVDGENLKSGKILSCGCLGNSKGEIAIINLLTQNQIPFVKEKTFDNCIYQDTQKKQDLIFIYHKKTLSLNLMVLNTFILQDMIGIQKKIF